MLALLQDTPPGAALLAITGLLALLIACRALVAYGLSRAVISRSRPQDLPKALTAVRAVVDSAFRLKR